MSEKRKMFSAGTVTIKIKDCPGQGPCTATADVDVVYPQGVSVLEGSANARVGTVQASVTDPTPEVLMSGGTYLRTFTLSADVAYGQTHRINAGVEFLMEVTATDVDVDCP